MKKIYKQQPDMSFTDVTFTSKAKNILLIIAILVILAMVFSFTFKKDTKQVNIKQTIIRDTIYLKEEFKDIPLTDSAITSELVRQGCVLPNVALAQAKIESTHFKSNIAKENKNIFGIRNSSSIFAKGLNRGHTVYKSYKDCISDFIRVQNKYLKNINGKYAESPTYTQKIKSLK